MDAHPSTRDPAVIKEEGNTPVRGNEKNKMSVREMVRLVAESAMTNVAVTHTCSFSVGAWLPLDLY